MGLFSKLKYLATLRKQIENENERSKDLKEKIKKQEAELELITQKLNDKEQLEINIRESLERDNLSIRNQLISDTESELSSALSAINENQKQLDVLIKENQKLDTQNKRSLNQAKKFKSELIGLKNFNKNFKNGAGLQYNENSIFESLDDIIAHIDESELINTLIKLPLHTDNSKELKKLSRTTRKEIEKSLELYKERYTTKGNKAIYQLMIIALQAEMQLLLYQLTYQKLDETKEKVKAITQKYLIIAAEGNKSILPTITRFISEIEPLYIELVDIEYRYYIYRQREKEEQQAIKERMKQESDEKKALEIERKKLDKEESKYLTEIQKSKEQLILEEDKEKIDQLNKRLSELQEQLNAVSDKREEIISLTTGKAGYVYVISNLGAFGENIFKIGMTRRLEPQQRIDELGSASVPFKFDVHALIFSDDAVELENSIHKKLSEYRVNKVNFRKEFFKTNIEYLENIVEEIDPTSEFTKTMFAEEYIQTLAIEENI